VQGWDRYVYVNNNPVKYNDPSGHYICEDSYEGCNNRNTTFKYTISDMILRVESRFGMDVRTEYPRENYGGLLTWTLNQVNEIYNSLQTMAAGLNKITNEQGMGWIKRNLGGTIFRLDYVANILRSAFVTDNVIHIPTNFDSLVWNSIGGTVSNMLIHEMGHVFDNRLGWSYSAMFGGGGGDALMDFLGIRPRFFLRFTWGISAPQELYWPDIPGVRYGNNSTSDYFAHSFTDTIIGTNIGLQEASFWMEAVIDLTN